jgi:hypothetical protein
MYSFLVSWQQPENIVPTRDAGAPIPAAAEETGKPNATAVPGPYLVEISLAAIARTFIPSGDAGALFRFHLLTRRRRNDQS